MRLALVSDIHGNLAALEAVAADIRHREVEQVINLGDNLSGPLQPFETARFLMSSGWLSLAGNHDRQLLSFPRDHGGPSDEYAHSQLTTKELEWLRTLEPSVRFTEEIYLCHGTPRSDCDYLLETVEGSAVRLADRSSIGHRLAGERSSVIACGHSHTPRSVKLGSGQLVVNPGSVGLPAYTGAHPMEHVVETGSPDARYAIIERTPAGWVTQHFTVPYDSKPMAMLARQRCRPDWERALMSGYVT